MESRMANIIFNKAGGNAGPDSKGCKLSLPSSWVKQLGISELDREVRIDFDGEKITVSKRVSVDEFIEIKLHKGHHIAVLDFFDGSALCTRIAADFTDVTIAALFLNDDRHLNNIAVLYEAGRYSYCPIFDNGAGLLSNTQMLQMDIAPKALIATLKSRPLGISFTRQMNTARSLYGAQIELPKLNWEQIKEAISPMLDYYAARDRGLILDRVSECILTMQKKMM